MKHNGRTNAFYMRILLSGACMFLLGCGAEVLTTTAIRGELDAQNVKSAVRQLDRVKGQMDDVSFKQAVQAYKAEHGSNPPSLEALVPKYLVKMPQSPDGTPYSYDPATGTLSKAPAGGILSAADQQTISAIKSAINQYGTATGLYPATLDDLYPKYLAQLPRTTTGESFIYNNQNGDVRHPYAYAPAPTPMPVGQAQTSNAVSLPTHVKGTIRDISGQQNDRQNQAMDDLGL